MAAFVVLHYQLLLSACTTIKSNPHAVQRSICLKSYKQRQKEILTQLFQIKKKKKQQNHTAIVLVFLSSWKKNIFRKWNKDTYNTDWSISGEIILLIYITPYLVSKLNSPLPSIWWQMFILLWDSHHSVFLLTQLLQNKPSINLSATLPFSLSILHTKQTATSA